MAISYTEDHLVEQPAIQLIQHVLGWDLMNCYGEPSSLMLRRSGWEAVLVSLLRSALQRMHPDLPVEAIEGAVEEIRWDRTALSPAKANWEIGMHLKQGVKREWPRRVRAESDGRRWLS